VLEVCIVCSDKFDLTVGSESPNLRHNLYYNQSDCAVGREGGIRNGDHSLRDDRVI
jgi:hypothetical protein